MERLCNSEIRKELADVGARYLREIAPQMPQDVAELTAKFIADYSTFYLDSPIVRAPMDRCAANYEEYPLPIFDWPWPEFEKDLSEFSDSLPEWLRSINDLRPTHEGVQKRKSWILTRPDWYWLSDPSMAEMRKYQKDNKLGPARSKVDLAKLICASENLPLEFTNAIHNERQRILSHLHADEITLSAGTAEIFKEHVIRLAQSRIDAYFSVTYGINSYNSRRKKNEDSANRHYADARHIDLVAEGNALRELFRSHLGSSWEMRPAAMRLFNNLLHNVRWAASATLDDFMTREEDWSKEHQLISLEILNVCEVCKERSSRIDYSSVNDLPPYGRLCSCSPPYWKYDLYVEGDQIGNLAPKSEAQKSIAKLVEKNLRSGLDFTPPTIGELVDIVEMQMKDEERN